MKVLITGGAGFIGSRLAAALASEGATVTVLDCLSAQIHGDNADFSAGLAAVATCMRGDVRDRDTISAAVRGQDAIVNLAAETGTGQSMYAVDRYSSVNLGGTSLLFDVLVNERPENLKKVIVASSRAVYGEGLYHCAAHGPVYPETRTAAAMRAGQFEPVCPVCVAPVTVLPTPETAPFGPSSFYGLTKQVQEQTTLMFANALGLDAFALRYQNVFGPGQSLANPYTGILAIFANLARDGAPISVFEDGHESRDFVYIDDVVAATARALRPEARGVHALNVGSGVRVSVMDVAQAIVAFFGGASDIRVTGDFRVGDIRHNVADISRARAVIGYAPAWTFAEGVKRFLEWSLGQESAMKGYEQSLQELAERGLMGRAETST